jgi:hypothetical protein
MERDAAPGADTTRRGLRSPISRRSPRMSKPVLVTVGVIIAILGAIFTLQGLGFIGGSAMTGSTLWAILGPIIAVAGIVIAVIGLRRGRKT